MSLEINAAKRREKPPAWVADAATKFYKPLGWAISVSPEVVLGPYRDYNLWCLKRSGIDFEHYVR
jgi:hypothetical protein